MTEAPPCDRNTARCQGATSYEVELPECCRGHVIRLMQAVTDLLDKVGAVWWADYGTLLGAVRNPMTTWADYPWLPQEGRETEGPHAGIIPHDKDADLSVLFKDWRKVLRVRARLQRLGFNVTASYMTGAMKIRLSHMNTTNVDLFFWHERSDGTLYRKGYARSDEFKGKEFPREMIDNMGEVEWEGMALPAPADPEVFLAMRYGENWRTPVMANNDGVQR